MYSTMLISLALWPWGLQIYFGWRQIKQFNRYFEDFCHQHQTMKITLGCSSGRFRPKLLVVFAIDDEDNIKDHFVLQGVSIFAKPKKLANLYHQPINNLLSSLNTLFPKQHRVKEAINDALKK